jgi:hypothetical protein
MPLPKSADVTYVTSRQQGRISREGEEFTFPANGGANSFSDRAERLPCERATVELRPRSNVGIATGNGSVRRPQLTTTLLRIEFQASGDIGLRNFYVHRNFRLWPLF